MRDLSSNRQTENAPGFAVYPEPGLHIATSHYDLVLRLSRRFPCRADDLAGRLRRSTHGKQHHDAARLVGMGFSTRLDLRIAAESVAPRTR